MTDLPSGTVTFLFTDIEGSTRLWEEHPQAMAAALPRHDPLLRQAIAGHGGQVFKSMGDEFCAAFGIAPEALAAALTAQPAPGSEPWGEAGPVRVRMALHGGGAGEREGDYFGPALNRVARLLEAAQGGQVLLSLATEELVREALRPGASLRDLGSHRLKDLHEPEHIFQLLHPDLPAEFPPVRSLEAFAHNLRAQLTGFIGREKEMARVRQLLARQAACLPGFVPGQAACLPRSLRQPCHPRRPLLGVVERVRFAKSGRGIAPASLVGSGV